MKKRNMMVAAVLTTVLLASGSVLAERPDRERGFGHFSKGGKQGHTKKGKAKNFQHIMPRGSEFKRASLALKLQLTSEQRAEIRGIRMTYRDAIQDVADQIVLNRRDIKGLVKALPYDEDALQALANTQGDLISQFIVLKSNSRASVRAVLTEEQRALLDKEKSGAKDID